MCVVVSFLKLGGVIAAVCEYKVAPCLVSTDGSTRNMPVISLTFLLCASNIKLAPKRLLGLQSNQIDHF